MSRWYSFYLGYKKDGVFHGLAPYKIDDKGNPKLISIFGRSSSFVSDLPDDFRSTSDEKVIGDDIKFIAEEQSWISDAVKYNLKYLPYKDLLDIARSEGIKRGYVDKEIVNSYEVYADKKNTWFYECDFEEISPIVYNTMSKKEQSKYMFYMWIDYASKEYIANLISNIASEFIDFNIKEEDIYILLE